MFLCHSLGGIIVKQVCIRYYLSLHSDMPRPSSELRIARPTNRYDGPQEPLHSLERHTGEATMQI